MPDSLAGAEVEKTEAASTDVNVPAESSTAEVAKETPSLLDAVTAALDKGKGSEETPASAKPETEAAEKPLETTSEAPETTSDTEEDDGFTEVERAALSEKTRNRMKKLAGEKKTLSAEVDSLRGRAESFDRMSTFVREQNLDAEGVDTALNIASLIRNNPTKALEQLTPIVERLRALTGHVLPDDLAEDVRLGFVTKPRAEELARAQAQARLIESREAERQQRAEQDRQRSTLNEQVAAGQRASSEWYAEQQTKDPDYKSKHTRIADRFELELLRQRKIPTADEAKAMLTQIKIDVDRDFSQLLRKTGAKQEVNGSASPASKPKPKTLADAVSMALGG